MTAFCNHFIRVDLCDVCSPIKDPRSSTIDAIDNARWHVERAQAEAMKEKP